MTFFELFRSSGAVEVEIFRLVYLLSLLISLWVYYEKENSPGGIITAGSVLLLLGYPIRILFLFITTLLIIPIHSFIEKKILKKMILVTRDRMLLRVFTAIVLSAILYVLFHLFAPAFPLGILGTVSPALLSAGLANKDRRKGTLVAFLYAVIIGILSYLVIKLVYVYFIPQEYLVFIEKIYSQQIEFDYVSVLIMYGLFAGITIYNFFARRSRLFAPVGMMIGAYLGLLVFRPLHLLFIVLVIILSSLMVKLIDRVSLLYGYRLFVLSSLVSSCIYIFLEITAKMFLHFDPLYGITLAGIIVCSVVTSEIAQNNFKKMIGSYLSIFIFSGVLFLATFAVSWGIVRGNAAALPSIYHDFILKDTVQ